MRRGAFCAGALMCAAGLLSACGPAASSQSPTPTPTPTISPSPSPSPTPSTSTATPTAAQCTASWLQVKLIDEQGAAGTIHAEFELRSAAGTCVLNGYPGVVMLNPSEGALSTSVQQESGTSAHAVALPAGTAPVGAVATAGHAWFMLAWNDSQCAGSQANIPSSWRFTLPGAPGSIDVSARDQSGALPLVCNGAVTVGPVQNHK